MTLRWPIVIHDSCIVKYSKLELPTNKGYVVLLKVRFADLSSSSSNACVLDFNLILLKESETYQGKRSKGEKNRRSLLLVSIKVELSQ